MHPDTLARLEQLIRSGAEPKLAPDFDTTGSYYIVQPDGQVNFHTAETPPEVRTHRSITGFIEAVRLTSETTERPSVYFDHTKAIARAHRSDWNPFETHHLRLDYTKPFQALLKLAERSRPEAMDAHELILFLRSTLDGMVPEGTIETFRRLKLTIGGSATEVIDKSRVGVDRSIQKRMQTEAGVDIPDEILVAVPIYSTPETRSDRWPITILVDPTPKDDRVLFGVTVVDASLTQARDDALERIGERLADGLGDKIPVFYGY